MSRRMGAHGWGRCLQCNTVTNELRRLPFHVFGRVQWLDAFCCSKHRIDTNQVITPPRRLS